MVVVTCPIKSTYLVRASGPLPMGQTEASASVAVFRYSFGLVCQVDGAAHSTSRDDCLHVRAVREREAGGE